MRRALAIQMIINREWGLAKNENLNQGSFIVEELTDLVEEAVLLEFDRITERGGVLGAMETGYQRSKIQEESLYYETLKHAGKLPIIGVNTFRDPDANWRTSSAKASNWPGPPKRKRNPSSSGWPILKNAMPKRAPAALERLQQVALSGENIFAELMETVRVCSLGQITQALYRGGRKISAKHVNAERSRGRYKCVDSRNMSNRVGTRFYCFHDRQYTDQLES